MGVGNLAIVSRASRLPPSRSGWGQGGRLNTDTLYVLWLPRIYSPRFCYFGITSSTSAVLQHYLPLPPTPVTRALLLLYSFSFSRTPSLAPLGYFIRFRRLDTKVDGTWIKGFADNFYAREENHFWSVSFLRPPLAQLRRSGVNGARLRFQRWRKFVQPCKRAARRYTRRKIHTECPARTEICILWKFAAWARGVAARRGAARRFARIAAFRNKCPRWSNLNVILYKFTSRAAHPRSLPARDFTLDGQPIRVFAQIYRKDRHDRVHRKYL